jgi:hypothetical protein
MAKPGPQKINRYGDAFKLQAVQMSNVPGVLIKVSVRRTRLENVDGVGDDGVHQGFKWTPWNTPSASVGGATMTS